MHDRAGDRGHARLPAMVGLVSRVTADGPARSSRRRNTQRAVPRSHRPWKLPLAVGLHRLSRALTRRALRASPPARLRATPYGGENADTRATGDGRPRLAGDSGPPARPYGPAQHTTTCASQPP